VEDAERELWCKAWRLIVRHGDAVDQVIETAMQCALQSGNDVDVAEWQQIAVAVEQLAK
jgi:hypothetical protein